MKRCFILIILLCISLSVYSQEVEKEDFSIRVDIFERGYPIIYPFPGQSSVQMELDNLFVFPLLNKTTAIELQYVASSWTFNPNPYFEATAKLKINHPISDKVSFKYGIGTGLGYNQQNGEISVPFLISTDLNIHLLSWLEIRNSLDFDIYIGGIYSELSSFLSIQTPRRGVQLNLGGFFSYMLAWEVQKYGYSYGMNLGLGFRI